MRNFIVCIVYAERAVRLAVSLVVGNRRECSLYDWERLHAWPSSPRSRAGKRSGRHPTRNRQAMKVSHQGFLHLAQEMFSPAPRESRRHAPAPETRNAGLPTDRGHAFRISSAFSRQLADLYHSTAASWLGKAFQLPHGVSASHWQSTLENTLQHSFHQLSGFGTGSLAARLEDELNQWLRRGLSWPGMQRPYVFTGPLADLNAVALPAQRMMAKAVRSALKALEPMEPPRTMPQHRPVRTHAPARGRSGHRTGAVQWETRNDALMDKRRIRIDSLSLRHADTGAGSSGSVSIFTAQDNRRIAAKIMKPVTSDYGIRAVDELKLEMSTFNRMYRKVGSHPNIVKMYGIAEVPMNGRMERALLMDAIPGPTADKFFRTLRQAWQSGKISSEEYWSVVQQCGRDMLDAVEHLAKAGILHNDIRPQNCIIDSRTGKLVVVDFGRASIVGSENSLGDLSYMSSDKHRDTRSDVFSAGATLVRAVEGYSRYAVDPRSGASRRLLPRDGAARGKVLRPDGRHGTVVNSNRIGTAWTNFADTLLARDIRQRPGAPRAKQQPFLADSMLDSQASRKAIGKVLRIAAAEKAKPPQARWRTPASSAKVSPARLQTILHDLRSMEDAPTLALLEKLQHNSKTFPKLARYLADGGISEAALPILELEAATSAKELVNAEVLKALRRKARHIKGSSGRRVSQKHDGEGAGKIWAKLAKRINADNLERHAADIDRLLLQASLLPGGVRDGDTAALLTQLKADRDLARDALYLHRLASADGKTPANAAPQRSSVKDRVAAFEGNTSMQAYPERIRLEQERERERLQEHPWHD